MEKNVKIIVLGRNYTSILGMVRAVSGICDDIVVIRSVGKIDKSLKTTLKKIILGKGISESSKFIKKYDYTIEPNREMLIEKILKENDVKKQILVIPTDDFTASTIDLNLDKLPSNYFFPNIEKKVGKIVELMDKNIQKKLATKCELLNTSSWIINCKKGTNNYIIPKELKYPVFLKPLISFNGTKEIMKKCENEQEIKQILNKIPKDIDCPILAEEYIEIEKEYAILGCSYNEKVFMPAIIEMLESGEGAHKGVTLKGKITSLNKNDKLYQKLKEFIVETKLNGLFDIDLYESNGNIYFNELNLRFGASGFAITDSGANLPELFINMLLNKSTDENIKINTKEKFFINEKVNLEKYRDGFISYKKYAQNMKNADTYFIKSQNDKKPYINFKKNEIIARIKMSINGLLRRGK